MRLLSSGRCRTCGGSPYATLSAMVGAGKPASIGLILEITSKYSVSVKEQQNPMAREPGQRTRIRPTVNTTITALTGPANPQTSQARPTMKKIKSRLRTGHGKAGIQRIDQIPHRFKVSHHEAIAHKRMITMTVATKNKGMFVRAFSDRATRTKHGIGMIYQMISLIRTRPKETG